MLSDNLNFLFGEFVPRCTHDIDKTFDDYQTLQYMAGGEVELSIDGKKQLLRGRNFWSCYAGPRIAFHVAPGRSTWVHRYIAFRGPLVSRWEAAGLFPLAPQPSPVGFDFDARFDRVLELSRDGDRMSHLRGIHELEGILIDLADARSSRPQQPAWLKKVLARLNEPDASYEDIADEIGATASTLRRRFRAEMGISPHQYVLQHRIAEARRLLGETNEPIKSIARRLGYRDIYFFSRQFKLITGVPPAMYRKSRQG
jgi:AraC-like DNA-binding protein